jgi:lipid-binding SYLF domain-containing protein
VQTFAADVVDKTKPFANAPWCKLPCVKIHLIVWGTILGTIGLQIVLLYLLPKMKKMNKWQKYTLYGILTVASFAAAAYILPQYLKDGFIIGRCFIGDPMGCQ